MKKIPDPPDEINPPFRVPFRRGPALATALAFAVSLGMALKSVPSNGNPLGDLQDFEVGKVAERDVTAENPVSYLDETATQLRIEAQQRLVLAVFIYTPEITREVQQEYDRFLVFSQNLLAERVSQETYQLKVMGEFPGLFNPEILHTLFTARDPAEILQSGKALLDQVMEKGIFALPQSGLAPCNPDTVELLRRSEAQTSRERLDSREILTLGKEGFPPGIPYDLIKPFIKENVVFSFPNTQRRLEEASDQVEPVIRHIEPGKRIIKKGFIVTEEDMILLKALNTPAKGDPRLIMGQFLLFLLLYGFFIFLGTQGFIGRALKDPEIYLLSALTALYIIGAVLIKNSSFDMDYFPVSILLPTALAVILPAILIGPPLALLWAMALPLGGFLSGSFDTPAYIFALVSGAVASAALHGAEKRMDLVRTGLIVAGANGIAATALLLIQRAPWGDYPIILFWAVFNGIASGMLVLGVLPPLEHALNAATAFRLIELSDLNNPILKRLFTTASGTYSHSLLVANLAEAACRKIGANPLLARVGAYYHDIGKMEQPDFFVENQSCSNKHNDITPELSASIIRSHVSSGVAKARSLGLPQEVINIVAEHHGNSIITWFYKKALEQDPQANPEDFSYPGIPPRSRESAVVMLADVSEAAVRTLENPTPANIDQFIQELIDAKVEHGQLAASALTFQDLETIKGAFVQVLGGYYHSRIKYPKLPTRRELAANRGNTP